MPQTIDDTEVTGTAEATSIIPSQPGRQPIVDLNAFMTTLPDMEFEPGEFEAFEQAIAEDRAQRRAMCAQEAE